MDNKEDSVLKQSSDPAPEPFPAGLKVLVVDDDQTCLVVLKRMLEYFSYKVTSCNRAHDALSMLREDKTRFDIVMSDLHMPDMDGFKLLETVGLELDLPVVMMSSDDSKETIMKGIIHGACDYLVKPIPKDSIKMIWQHVVRKNRNLLLEHLGSEDGEVLHSKQTSTDQVDHVSATNKRNVKSTRRKDEEECGNDNNTTVKKRRTVWSPELHQMFIDAVNQLGRDRAVPKKILECMERMGAKDLTREIIASHLQKFRLFLQRLRDPPHDSSIGDTKPLVQPRKSNFEQSSPLDSRNLLMYSNSSQVALPSPALPYSGGHSILTTSTSIGLPLIDQQNQFESKTPELNAYPLAQFPRHDFPNSGLVYSYKTLPSVGISSSNIGDEYRNVGHIAPYSRNLSVVDPCDVKSESMPELIQEPLLYFKNFDHDDIFRGPFT